MQALLSFGHAPPLSAPMRFFLSAPLFGIFAGMLLLSSGPESLASRWTPSTLALTHLLTAGFMLQIMLGAMVQILPVVAGANIRRPLLMARLVHASAGAGALTLVAGFLNLIPFAYSASVLLLGGGVTLFVTAAGHALYRVPTTNPTIRGLKLALFGLSVTTVLGVLLATARAGNVVLSLPSATSLHVAWGFFGWGCVLLSAVALIVVPMFQITPRYPEWFARPFSGAVFGGLCFWSLAVVSGEHALAAILSVTLAVAASTFAVLTIFLQRRSLRPRFDATQRCWRVAMSCTVAACLLATAVECFPEFGERLDWPLTCGVLVLVGGFMSVLIGMLYKIVPFLIWLHLQNQGGGRVLAPNMNKMIAGQQVDRQTRSHFLSIALLLAATLWPAAFTYPAAATLVVANGWLLRNLLAAVGVYRRECSRMAALPADTSGG